MRSSHWRLSIAAFLAMDHTTPMAFQLLPRVVPYPAKSVQCGLVHRRPFHSTVTAMASQSSNSEAPPPCNIPTDVETFDLVAMKGAGKLLRATTVTNVAGSKVPLGDVMGKGTSVVIFLRHLG